MTRVKDLVEAMSTSEETFKGATRAELESLSVEQWTKKVGGGRRAMLMMRTWTRGITGAEHTEVSILSLLEIARGGLGITNLRHDGENGGQHLRLKEGTQSIAKGMAKLLPEGTIKLNSPVTAISQSRFTAKHGYVVRTASNGEVTARKVIISIPTTVYKEISFNPPLPRNKRLHVSASRYGHFVKYIALFRTPFWRENGACGLGQSFVGPINHFR